MQITTLNINHQYSIVIWRPKWFHKTELICSLITRDILSFHELSRTWHKSNTLRAIQIPTIYCHGKSNNAPNLWLSCISFYTQCNELSIILISMESSFPEWMRKSDGLRLCSDCYSNIFLDWILLCSDLTLTASSPSPTPQSVLC